ncbi:hypothetical protein HYT01_00715 [Candidatus Giovannonibacteria bacterium]|nr:hypothetical protein [Candidatus Giovannonibacteria bacterium]
MAITKIGFLGHFYQPPTQPWEIILQIYRECYKKVFDSASRLDGFAFSMDLAKSLGERMPPECIAAMSELFKKRRLELVNTSAYHYLLPLVPTAVAERQLELNRDFYRSTFGPVTHPEGFFPPELATFHWLWNTVSDQRYDWCVADDELFNYTRPQFPEHEKVPQNWIPEID